MPGSVQKPRLRWLILATGCLVAAVLVASQTYLSMLHHGHEWWRLFLWQAVSWSFWALLAPWLIGRGEALHGRPPLQTVLLNVVAGGLLVPLHIAFSALVLVGLQPYMPVEAMSFARAMRYLQTPWALVDLLIVSLLIVCGYVLAGRRRNRALALRESRLETELARAQLEALRLKIQPHFLFNTLNSVAALVRKGANEQALEMVIGLSDLLRVSLDRSGDQLVALREEVEFVSRYVDLHVQRFADRLDFRQRIADESLDCQIPSFILQPLVENAIRHGIARSPSGGTITLTVEPVDAGMVTLRVEDDGPGLPPSFSLADSQGIGLASIRSRLEQLYDRRTALSLQPRPGGGTIAALHLPVEPSASTREIVH